MRNVRYLRNRQPAKIIALHIIVLLSALSQIVVSNFMGFTGAGGISTKSLNFYGTWTHITIGLCLLPITFVFLVVVIRERGFKYFFPYFYGDFTQLKSDITKLKKFNLPEPESGGLAAIVKGLGLGALFLTLFYGMM